MMSQGWSQAGNPLLKVHSHNHEKGRSLSLSCTIQFSLCVNYLLLLNLTDLLLCSQNEFTNSLPVWWVLCST